MKREELYHRNVDILVAAYFNNTLEHASCSACAIGNLVAAHNNIPMIKISGYVRWDGVKPSWGSVHITSPNVNGELQQKFYRGSTVGHQVGKLQLESTGYNILQTAKIEYAFETAPQGESDDEYMFNGLMAVIDVLDSIHENTDSEVTESTKSRFIKGADALCTG